MAPKINSVFHHSDVDKMSKLPPLSCSRLEVVKPIHEKSHKVLFYVVIRQKQTSTPTAKIWFLILKISYYFLQLRIHLKVLVDFKNKQ